MPKKTLIETNAHLREARRRRAGLITNVATSTSVETGGKPETIARTLKRHGRVASLRSRQRSAR